MSFSVVTRNFLSSCYEKRLSEFIQFFPNVFIEEPPWENALKCNDHLRCAGEKKKNIIYKFSFKFVPLTF